jgi:cytochrome c
MSNKRTTALLMTALIAVFYGCQPDAPVQQVESKTEVATSLVASQVPLAEPVLARPVSKAGEVLSEGEARKLAQSSKCFACHAVDKKLVGPAWKEVAAKYRGQKDAEAKLITKIAKGGSGVWGLTAMPPNAPRVAENDIKALAHFILSIK